MDDSLRKPLGIGLGVAAAGLAWKYIDSNYLISQDVGFIRKALNVQNTAKAHIAAGNTTADIWETNWKKNPQKPCFIFEGKKYSYQEIEEGANRVAHWALSVGVKPGNVVALFMDNRPEYFMTWLGIAKVGGVTALLNYNVKGKPLVHSIKISGASILIVGDQVEEPIQQVVGELKDFKIYSRGKPLPYAQDLDAALPAFSHKPPPRKVRESVKFGDKALLVYTSGTTGLPKAATIKHLRFFNMGYTFATVFEIKPDDVIYTVLPLYHSAGGLCGVGMMLHSGATIALRNKFSATAFWDDCYQSKATVIQYIGELCRYLVGAPPKDTDKKHNVRIAIGNGLRPEIWNEFQDRFGIRQVGEFYGSTEGNAALLNFCTEKKHRGAVGQMGPLLYKLSGMKLVKFDVIKEEPIKDKNGFCIECGPNEPGELLGEIDNSDPMKGFDGYHGNDKATQSKILKDAFKKGDAYFRTGDLLKRDLNGCWFFVDRIGDTFRWKGENVSTTEVTEVISVFPGISEANVYGVAIPGMDGRACCAGVVAQDVDWDKFAKHCKDNLPAYAQPVFIRLLPKIEITGTFKHQKVELRTEGCDVTKIKDPMLWFDPAKKTYVPFGLKEFQDLTAGRAKL